MRLLTLLACLLLTTLAAAQRGICFDQDGKAYPKGCPDTPWPTLRVQTSAASAGTITVSTAASIRVLCEPAMDGDKWTPHVKNCKLATGTTLDDVINAMTDKQEADRKWWAEREKLLHEGLDKGIKAATLYKQAYEKCSSVNFRALIERHDY